MFQSIITFQFIDPSDGQAKHTMFLAPSISTNDYRNPAGRVWHMDGDTFEVTDYTQYYIDLKIADGNIIIIVMFYAQTFLLWLYQLLFNMKYYTSYILRSYRTFISF